jgi:hypothetical protein
MMVTDVPPPYTTVYTPWGQPGAHA